MKFIPGGVALAVSSTEKKKGKNPDRLTLKSVWTDLRLCIIYLVEKPFLNRAKKLIWNRRFLKYVSMEAI